MSTDPLSGTFDAYARTTADPRFTEWLRGRAEPDWTAATTHRFTRKLGNDTLDEGVFRRYLLQDYAALQAGATVTGYAVGQAPTMAEKARLTESLAVLTGDEHDYFERSFDALDVPEDEYSDPSLTPTTRAFCDLGRLAAYQGDFEETLASILAGEWVYFAWADAVADDTPSRFYLAEWIDIHHTERFEAYVEWLRNRLDEYGPALSPRRQRSVESVFTRKIALEVAFFEQGYDSPREQH